MLRQIFNRLLNVMKCNECMKCFSIDFSENLFWQNQTLFKKLCELISFLRYDKKKENQAIKYQISMIIKIISLFANDLFPNDIFSVEELPTLLKENTQLFQISTTMAI